jgi:hypothetical protein
MEEAEVWMNEPRSYVRGVLDYTAIGPEVY